MGEQNTGQEIQPINRHVLMEPPECFEFNNLIVDLSTELEKSSDNSFEIVKTLLSGIISNDVVTWIQLFNMMCTKGYIAKDNIVYLQMILYKIARQDLISKLMEYTQKSGEDKTLHFIDNKIPPDNEQREVQFHVKGHGCTTHEDAQEFRRKVARILCIPEQNVILNGIQPANSVLISLIIPYIYADILVEILQDESKKNYLAPLVKFGVDQIIVEEKIYDIKQQDSGVESNVDDKVTQLQNANIQLQRQLQQKEVENMRMEKEIINLERQINGSSPSLAKRKLTPEDVREDSEKLKRIKFEDENETASNEIRFQQSDMDDIQYPELSSTTVHAEPLKDGHIEIDKDKLLLYKKLNTFSGMSMTMRKLIKKARIPQDQQVTPDDINAQALYGKVMRIYPTPYIPKKETN